MENLFRQYNNKEKTQSEWKIQLTMTINFISPESYSD